MEASIDGDGGEGPPAKKARHDYSVFKTDVARLQKNLDAFEADLKEHTMQVQLKLACTRKRHRHPSHSQSVPTLSQHVCTCSRLADILSALDDSAFDTPLAAAEQVDTGGPQNLAAMHVQQPIVAPMR
mgnify:FL=1